MSALDLDSGKATALYSFAANENGCAEPKALVYQDGALYGDVRQRRRREVYKIVLKTWRCSLLHRFGGGTVGGVPTFGLTQFHRKLNGATQDGGADGHGEI